MNSYYVTNIFKTAIEIKIPIAKLQGGVLLTAQKSLYIG
jgi:hypothetical protein